MAILTGLKTHWCGFCAIAILGTEPALGAAPVVISPQSDAQVVEVLPAANRDIRLRRTAANRSDTLNAATLLAAADRHLRLARRTGDPRELGRAQALLSRPRLRDHLPATLKRAGIRQSLHDFDGALAQLHDVIRRHPGVTAARLMRSNIYRVQGKLSDALRDCTQAFGIERTPQHAICVADIAHLSGDRRASDLWLRRAGLDRGSDRASSWTSLVLAEMAVRTDDHENAARHYRRALIEPDSYVLDSYTQWLMSQGRAQEAIRLLLSFFEREALLPDALLLRLIEAHAQQKNSSQVRQLVAKLQARFRAARNSGSRLHLRERAQFELQFGAMDKALQLATQNWQTQRESADALVLARSAIESGDSTTLAQLRQFIQQTGFDDSRLNRLLAGRVAK